MFVWKGFKSVWLLLISHICECLGSTSYMCFQRWGLACCLRGRGEGRCTTYTASCSKANQREKGKECWLCGDEGDGMHELVLLSMV